MKVRKPIQIWKPDGEPLLVRGEYGAERVELRHTQPRPDKAFRPIPSVPVDRDDLAERYPSLALRLAAEKTLARTCGHSQDDNAAELARISREGERGASILLKIARSRAQVHRVEERCGAIEALGAHPSAEVADGLQDLADDRREASAVRCAALLSLGTIGSGRAIRTLEKRLRSGPAVLRRAAARALAHAPPTSISALETAVAKDSDARVARQAYAAIRTIERRIGTKLSAARPPRAPRTRGVRRDAKADALTRDPRRSGGRR